MNYHLWTGRQVYVSRGPQSKGPHYNSTVVGGMYLEALSFQDLGLCICKQGVHLFSAQRSSQYLGLFKD